jgi:thiamine kinase-like enzyme
LDEGGTVSEAVLSETGAKLRSLLAKIPGWGDKTLGLSPMLAGLTNVNWRVDVEGDPQAYFVKVPGPGTEQFIDRNTVNAASRQASDMGVGPTVVFYDPKTGIEVAEFLGDYRPCTSEDLCRPEVSTQVIELYRQWHDGPALPQTKTVFEMTAEHREQVRLDGTPVPGWVEEVLNLYDEAAARFLASGLDIVPCHNDPNMHNFMLSTVKPPKPMKLVDYDYASNNERAYELGAFLGGINYYGDQTSGAIETYFGRCDPHLWARVQVMRVVTDVKWGLWALANARAWSGSGDFDYYKYGIWDLKRAHFEMHAADWQDQLGRL